MFCDEPTSGIDSYRAQSVVSHMVRMARNGKTIICTIHQPSSEVFAMFDRIMVMANGQVAFSGSRDDALTFFSKFVYFIIVYPHLLVILA